MKINKLQTIIHSNTENAEDRDQSTGKEEMNKKMSTILEILNHKN